MPSSEAVQGAPKPQATSLGLGERLRSARKARAMSVAQLASALKVEAETVMALEEDRFDALGAPVFVRGHLRRYAELVGLSTEAVLEAYRASAPDSDALPLVARRPERADAVRIGPWMYWLAAGLVVAGIVIAFSGNGDEEAEPAEVTLAPAVAPPAQVPATPARPQAPSPAANDAAPGDESSAGT